MRFNRELFRAMAVASGDLPKTFQPVIRRRRLQFRWPIVMRFQSPVSFHITEEIIRDLAWSWPEVTKPTEPIKWYRLSLTGNDAKEVVAYFRALGYEVTGARE